MYILNVCLGILVQSVPKLQLASIRSWVYFYQVSSIGKLIGATKCCDTMCQQSHIHFAVGQRESRPLHDWSKTPTSDLMITNVYMFFLNPLPKQIKQWISHIVSIIFTNHQIWCVVCLFVCLFVCFVCLFGLFCFVCVVLFCFACLFVWLFVWLFFVWLFVCLFVCLIVWLFACLLVCLFVCFCLRTFLIKFPPGVVVSASTLSMWLLLGPSKFDTKQGFLPSNKKLINKWGWKYSQLYITIAIHYTFP